MTDADLITQYRAGQVAAFNALVKRWESPIYNFILRTVGDRDAARDLCQKTFIRAYRSLRSLRDPQKFTAWIYQVARNICRDEARTRQHVSLDALRETDPSAADLPDESIAHPDAHLHTQDTRELIQRALQALPEEQRVIIIMKTYQGLKFTEIADALKIPVNTVKSRMYYGLTALKNIFERWNISEDIVYYEL